MEALPQPLAVLPWPADAAALKRAWEEQGLVVLRVETPQTAIRHAAREIVRQALAEALAIALDRAPAEIEVISSPGEPARLQSPPEDIGLSISHDAGITLAAMHRGGAVGVDVMRVEARIDPESDWETVARDYLGPQARARIAAAPPASRAAAFAGEWTRLEACIKCHGAGLAEWNPQQEERIAACRILPLDLAPGIAGAVAIPARRG